MIDGRGNSIPFGARLIAALLAGLVLFAAQAQAQQTYYPGQAQPTPGSAPAYPQQTYPNAGYPAQQSAYPGGYGGYPAITPQAPESHFFRDLFTGTLAAVLQNVTGGLFGTIAGRIMDWFSHRISNPAPAYNPANGYAGANPYPNAGYVAANGYPPQAPAYPTSAPAYPSPSPGYPASAAQGGMQPAANPYPGNTQTYTPPTSTYPATTDPNAYPAPTPAYPPAANTYPAPNTVNQSAGYGAGYPNAAPYGGAPAAGQSYAPPAPQVYDTRTGQLVTGAANPYSTRGVGMENGIYAGIAYEVDAIGADGHTAPINTVTYEFHTGDKFTVYYRPSLPGHMEIYNVNPQGQQTLIDSSTMAAGQMVALGPYQFTNQTGDEKLRLVLSPCSTPQLLAATRDIVRMDAPAQGSATSPTLSPALRLGSCDAPASRGVDVHTRDIEKVGVEGTTSFALDPLSGQELNSGQVTPREVSIVFHHR